MRYFQHSRIPSRSCFFNCKAGNCDDTDTIVWRLTWTMETNGRVNRTSARKSLSRLTVSESVCQTLRQSTHSWSISFGIVAFVSSLPGKAERSDVTNASVQVSRVDERNLPAAIKRSTVSSHGEARPTAPAPHHAHHRKTLNLSIFLLSFSHLSRITPTPTPHPSSPLSSPASPSSSSSSSVCPISSNPSVSPPISGARSPSFRA